MPVRAGINGFGRIGRCIARALAESGRDDVDIVAINSRSDIRTAAHLLQYDSTHGKLAFDVRTDGDFLIFGGRRIRYTRASAPDKIEWKSAGAELIMECSGAFNSKQAAAGHLSGGTRRVLISAPAKDADLSVVYGVNHERLDEGGAVISAASCTTNCLAPLAHILHGQFGIARGWATTVHALTADQRLLDESHKDLRRARSAVSSVIPTKTGAAESIGEIIPALRGKLDGIALRVPVTNVSLADLTCRLLSPPADAAAINDAFRAAAAEFPANVLAVSEAPLVSSDFNHTPHSAVVDAMQTRLFGDWAKVFAWYDNEWGFSNRMLDVAAAAG